MDGVTNLLLVLRLANDQLLAAYSALPLETNSNNQGPGFIANLSKKLLIHLDKDKPNAKIMVYDPYYMSFGNADLRISIGTCPTLSSNIHNLYSFFERSYTLEEFTGSTVRENEIDQY